VSEAGLPLTLAAILACGDAGRPALIFPDVQASFSDLRSAACRWAGWLQRQGVSKGDFVGVYLPTCPEFVELLFGVAAMGAVFVPINPRYRAREILHLVNDAELVAIVTTDQVSEQVDFVARLFEALPSAGHDASGRFACAEAPALREIVVIAGDGRDGTTPVDRLPNAEPGLAEVAPDDLVMVLYTSGTSAAPKGCLLTHEIVARSAAAYAEHYSVTSEDSFWCPLPIFHVAGIIPLLAIFSAGGAFLTLRHFDADDALSLVADWRPTCGLPSYVTIVQDLMGHPRFAGTDFGCFRWMNTSPSVQPPALRRGWAQAMPAVAQVGTYGMTEGVGPVTGHCVGDPPRWCNKGLGQPFKGWEVRIVDSSSRAPVEPGELGEIEIRGTRLAIGYHRRSEPIADSAGWFRTGDLGMFDDGQLVFRGRLKDMLKVGGENVAASEIEAVLNLHPQVRLAQVIGVSDPRYVEVPVAFVLPEDGPRPDPADLIAYCRGQLASFKIPREILFVDAWPMSTTKIQKFRLREIYDRRKLEHRPAAAPICSNIGEDK
jgi:fatty-acyl-CoA synthase